MNLPSSVEIIDTPSEHRNGFTLYRAYDASGALLYIGQAKNPMVRLAQHSRHSNGDWFKRCALIKLSHHAAHEIDGVERAAIRHEKPPYNRINGKHRNPAHTVASLIHAAR